MQRETQTTSFNSINSITNRHTKLSLHSMCLHVCKCTPTFQKVSVFCIFAGVNAPVLHHSIKLIGKRFSFCPEDKTPAFGNVYIGRVTCITSNFKSFHFQVIALK